MIKPQTTAVTGRKKTAADAKINVEYKIDATDVKKPLSVSATAFLINKETGETETTVKAKVVFSLVYLAEEGYKKAEATTEANLKLPAGDAAVTLTAQDARTIVNAEGGFTARCVLCAHAEKDAPETTEIFSEAEGVFAKRVEEETDVGTGLTSDVLRLEDEFEVNYALSDVLFHRESVSINEVQSGISSVIFDGEVNLSLALLPFSENSDIVKEKRTIPFRFEVENPGALPNMRAYGYADVRKVAVKVVADEEKNKSVITAEISIGLSGEAIDGAATVFVEDVYSKECELTAERKEILLDKFVGQYLYTEKVVGIAGGDAVEGGRLMAALGESITVYSAETDNSSLTITGVVRADALFRNADNGTASVPCELPFEITTEVVGRPILSYVALEDFSAKLRGGSVEFDCGIKAGYKIYEEKKVACVGKVLCGEPKEVNNSAISVYLPQKSDGLWEVAKALSESEEDVMKYNPDLTFPLDENSRIIIYRQKN